MLFYINSDSNKLNFKKLDGEILMDDILGIEEIKTPKDMKWAVERLCECIEEAVHAWYHDIYKKPDYYDHCNIEIYFDTMDCEDED